jgi:hypothetical protein
MQLERVAPTYGYEVRISWSRPASYEQVITSGSPYDAEGWLYMILGYNHSPQPKLFYIGKVFETCVSRRLRGRDHRARYYRMCHDHPRYLFRVSLGAIKLKRGHITARLVDDVESILIFAAYHSHKTLINKSKWYKSGWKHPYAIQNLRYRAPLPREVHHGVFMR